MKRLQEFKKVNLRVIIPFRTNSLLCFMIGLDHLIKIRGYI